MRVYDYVTGELWLKGGQKKIERPLYTRGARLFQRADHIAVSIPWTQQDTVLYYPDGTTTIQMRSNPGYWHPLFSQGVRGLIRDFSGLQDVHQRDSKFYIVENNAGRTPSKIQNCRQCKASGMQNEQCWGPSSCYRELPCESHPEAQVDPQRPSARWHEAKYCAHGKTVRHMVYRAHECYYCNGTGKRDYGSKLVSLQWDGFPIRLREGKVIKQEPTELKEDSKLCQTQQLSMTVQQQ